MVMVMVTVRFTLLKTLPASFKHNPPNLIVEYRS